MHMQYYGRYIFSQTSICVICFHIILTGCGWEGGTQVREGRETGRFNKQQHLRSGLEGWKLQPRLPQQGFSSTFIPQGSANPHLPRKAMHFCLSNFILTDRIWEWIFPKKKKWNTDFPLNDTLIRHWNICTEKARESSLWGLHTAQLTWHDSWVILRRYKQMTMPSSWSNRHSEGLLVLEIEKSFPTRKSRAFFSLPAPLDLGLDKNV